MGMATSTKGGGVREMDAGWSDGVNRELCVCPLPRQKNMLLRVHRETLETWRAGRNVQGGAQSQVASSYRKNESFLYELFLIYK
jgi:hypothetical protein